MARIVVTGGVGFIGHHVSRALLLRGDAVVIADDFSEAPYPAAEKRRNQRVDEYTITNHPAKTGY